MPCFLMCKVGFVYATFTQNNYDYSNYHVKSFIWIYFVFASACIATAVHIVLCTLVLCVFGPGLAINGPLGSMARAAEGLSIEQEHVVASFIVMMMFFAATTVIIFWALMDIAAASSSTIVMIIASYFWYSYCERIYLRFYWNKGDAGWEQKKNGTTRAKDDDDDDDEPRLPGASIIDSTSNPLHDETVVKEVQPSPKASFFTTLKERVGIIMTHNTAAAGSTSRPSLAGKKSVTTEGYLGIKRASVLTGLAQEQKKNNSNNYSGAKWKRQYFVLFSNGCLYTYRTRQEYRNDPSSPKYTRPIKVSEYVVGVQNLDLTSRLESEAVQADTQSVVSSHSASSLFSSASTSAAMANSRFQITLTPFGNSSSSSNNSSSSNSSSLHDDVTLRTLWLLRSDTEEEQDIWVEGLRAVSPNSFASNNLH